MAIRKSEVVTGTFMLAALATLVWLAFKPITQLFAEEEAFVAEFANVGLLEKDSQVTIGGLEVGRVRVLTPKPPTGAGTIKIEVQFDVKRDIAATLKKGTKAKIEQASFLGNKYIALLPSFEGQENLPQDPDGRFRVESEEYSDMFTMLNELKKKAEPILDQANILLGKLNNEVLSPANVQKISDIAAHADQALVNANTLVDDLKKFTGEANDKILGDGPGTGLIGNTDGLVSDARLLVADARTTVGDLKARLETTLANVDKLLADSDTAVVNLDKALQTEIKQKITAVLDNANTLVSKLNTQIDPVMSKLQGVLDGGQDLVKNPDLYGALYELRVTLQEAKLLMNSLRADPSQIFFGGPGEAGLLEKKKEKDESGERTSGRAKPYDY